MVTFAKAKQDDERGIALLVVYGANRPGADVQGHVVEPRDLFLGMATWAGRRRIGLEHAELPDGVVHVLSSYMTGSESYKSGEFTVPANTWVLEIAFNLDDEQGRELWERVKSGAVGGLSMKGTAEEGQWLGFVPNPNQGVE